MVIIDPDRLNIATDRAPAVDPVANAIRRLAAAVISQALTDATRRGRAERVRRHATAFLRGCPGLEFWARAAGVSLEVLRAHVGRMLAEAPGSAAADGDADRA